MMCFKYVLQLIVCCLLCLAAIGCISAKYVEQNQYLLNIKTLPEKKTVPDKCLVFVDHVMAITPFDQLDFLYRIKSNQYLTDYYHSFLVSPTEQLESIFTNYLKALGDFNLDTAASLTAQNKLQTQITEFYADYRDHDHPKAVIAIHFVLTRLVDSESVVLFDKVLHAQVALKEKDTSSLLMAWNVGLQDILTRGVRALNAVLSKNPCINSVMVSSSDLKKIVN
ncbi:ABC_trans_aux domain-containing protein [Gammaproteobacteria bacterium]